MTNKRSLSVWHEHTRNIWQLVRTRRRRTDDTKVNLAVIQPIIVD
jgi:hypothetical protein